MKEWCTREIAFFIALDDQQRREAVCDAQLGFNLSNPLQFGTFSGVVGEFGGIGGPFNQQVVVGIQF